MNKISVNLLWGESTGLQGVEFGGIANSYEKGVPIGFINIVKHGYHDFEIGGSEIWQMYEKMSGVSYRKMWPGVCTGIRF